MLAAETMQAPPYPHSIMREGRARMENISCNVDNIVEFETERFRTRLLTSPRTKHLYWDILINTVWSDGRQGSLRKPDYIFGAGSDCEKRHSTEHITFSFVHSTRETITVSIEHTYKRGSFALSLKQTIPARDENKIAWGIGECNF